MSSQVSYFFKNVVTQTETFTSEVYQKLPNFFRLIISIKAKSVFAISHVIGYKAVNSEYFCKAIIANPKRIEFK